MFKIPEWEDSVPAANVGFLKEINKKKHKQKSKNEQENAYPLNQSNNHDIGNIVKNPMKSPLQKKLNKSKQKNTIQNSVTNKNIPSPQNNITLSQKTPKNKTHVNKTIVKSKTPKKVNTVRIPSSNSTSNNKSNGGKKRKHETDVSEVSQNINENVEVPNLDTDKLDEAIFNTKKRKLNKSQSQEEKDIDGTFLEERKMTKEEQKKEKLRNMLQKGHRNVYQVNSNGLRDRMLQRLKAAQFRYLNEKLYTSSGSDAKKLFDEDPNAFQTYHEGYQQQVKKWPVKPLDIIVNKILKMPKSYQIVDMGCGEGTLSRRVPQTVRSFDLVAFNPRVEVCDIAHTPLLASSMNVAVYCLALMGTDLTQYIVEANRVLKKGGHLLIAEVESRFDDVDKFTKDVERIGFSLKKIDKSNNVFYFMEFMKVNEPPKKSKLPYLSLKPCFYKKR